MKIFIILWAVSGSEMQNNLKEGQVGIGDKKDLSFSKATEVLRFS